MPPRTREQLAYRRATQRRRRVRRDRRALISAAIPVLVVALLALILGLSGRSASDDSPLASPVAPEVLRNGGRPPEVVMARAEGVDLHLPVAPRRITAAAFHPTSDPMAIAMAPTSVLDAHQAPRDGRTGPETAGLDVGAPAGTVVYSPVDGVIASVSQYEVSGQILGSEITIAPEGATSGMLVRMNHLDPPLSGVPPRVGTPVTAGVTPVGRVLDFSTVAQQELARYTSDSGNHVAIDLVRAEADFLR